MTQEVEAMHPKSHRHFVAWPGPQHRCPASGFLVPLGVSAEPARVPHAYRTAEQTFGGREAGKEGRKQAREPIQRLHRVQQRPAYRALLCGSGVR